MSPREPKRAACKTLSAVGALLLVSSLAGNWLLGRLAWRNFAKASEVRLDPAGLKLYATDREHPSSLRQPGPPTLVFFGDSRAVMWPAPRVPGYQIVNRGVGNQTTAQMLLRFEADIVPLHPAVVVLEGGINDLKTLAEFPERRAAIVADCEANLARIVERSRQLGATVVLFNIIGVGKIPLWLRPFWSQEIPDAVREVNAFLPQLAGDKVRLVDANLALDDAHGEIRREYQWEYLHLSPVGYQALDRVLLPIVSSLPK
jgi:lysophospholipase L1-like esterase